MTTSTKANDHELPTLTGLESENIIVRKKKNNRKKPIRTESEPERKDRQPEE
jgi:hypothetical protein